MILSRAFEQPGVHFGDAALASVRWPSSALSRESTSGIRCESQTPCPKGTNLSCSPCQCSTGTRIAPSSKRHGRTKRDRRRSSRRGSADPIPHAVEDVGGEAAVRDLDVGRPEQRPPRFHELFRRDARQHGAVALEHLAMPLVALEDGADLLDVLLAHALGEVEAVGVVRRERRKRGRRAQRSGSSAASASACGPPPEIPQTRTARSRARRRPRSRPRRRPRPSALAAGWTCRAGPRPGNEPDPTAPRHRPRAGRRGSRTEGVPPIATRAGPSCRPARKTSSERPSGVVTVWVCTPGDSLTGGVPAGPRAATPRAASRPRPGSSPARRPCRRRAGRVPALATTCRWRGRRAPRRRAPSSRVRRDLDRAAEQVGLELHQEAVRVAPPSARSTPTLARHGVEHVGDLERDRLERGAREMGARRAAREAADQAARVGRPSAASRDPSSAGTK